uniref:Uncharacterized protein n=1 Tax=Cryptomonas curvata TaxID=233186 RepID=A0A7S0MWV5_9CRYP
MFADIHTFTALAQGGSTPVPIYFGAAHISNANVSTHLGDNFDAPVGSSSGVGAFNGYSSINAVWADTTDMDNLRADGSGELEVDSSKGTGYGNTVHTSSANDTSY